MSNRKDNIPIPQWKYAASIYLPRHHCLIFRDDALGVQKQVLTRRSSLPFFAHEREYYFIDGKKNTFRSEEKLLRVLSSLPRNGRNNVRR